MKKLIIKLELIEKNEVAKTTCHKTVSTYLAFSATYEYYENQRNKYNPDSWGGVFLNEGDTAEKFWNAIPKQEYELLCEWHLNDLCAGCCHMKDGKYERPEISGQVCYEPWAGVDGLLEPSKYKFGHEWLVRIIPPDIEKELRALMAKYNGKPILFE